MSSTYNDLIEDAMGILRGYVISQDQSTHLTGGVDADDLVWSVGDASRLSPGRLAVDNEIVYVDSFDQTNNTITIAPYGRGLDGSTAASHAALAQVVNNPRFPRYRVKRAINDTIQQVGSVGLFGVGSETFTTDGGAYSYELPVEATRVIDVQYEAVADGWVPLRNWRQDFSISTATHSTGKGLVTGRLPDSRTLEVTYAFDPVELDADSDDFAEVSGLPESCRDVIVFGACWRMLSAVGPGRLDNHSISAADLDSRGQAATAEQSESLQMYRSFNQRLGEERMRLLDRYKTATHNTRF